MATPTRNEYGKTLKILKSDGTTQEFKDSAANAFLKLIDNNPRFVKIATAKGAFSYYDINSASCGFCEVAQVTISSEEGTPTACEDGLPEECK